MKKSKEIIRPKSEKSKEISLKPVGVVAVGVYLNPLAADGERVTFSGRGGKHGNDWGYFFDALFFIPDGMDTGLVIRFTTLTLPLRWFSIFLRTE